MKNKLPIYREITIKEKTVAIQYPPDSEKGWERFANDLNCKLLDDEADLKEFKERIPRFDME